MNKSLIQLFIILTLTIFSGCLGYSKSGVQGPKSADPLRSTIHQPALLGQVHHLLVTPVESVRSSVPVQEHLSQMFYEATNQNLRLELTTQDLTKKEGMPGCYNDQAKQVAGALGADAILCLNISTYRERQGSRAGAESGAAIGFTLKLQPTEGDLPIWEASYYFEDKALSDNWFHRSQRSSGDRSGWHGAHELAARGFQLALQKLEEDRGAVLAQP